MTFADRITVHLERVLAILKVIRNGNLFRRQFVWLANGHKTGIELDRQWCRKNESSRLDANNGIYFFSCYQPMKSLDGIFQALSVLQKCCYVVKVYARLWEIRHFANEFSKMFHALVKSIKTFFAVRC